MKLYELTNQLMEIEELMEDPEVDVDSFQSALESVELEINEKAEGIGKLIRNYEATINGIKAEEQRLANSRRMLTNSIDHLKSYTKHELKKAGLKTAGTDLMHFNIQATAEKPVFENEDLFIVWCQKNDREDLLKYKAPEIARTEVKKALKNGEIFDGVHLEKGETIVLK